MARKKIVETAADQQDQTSSNNQISKPHHSLKIRLDDLKTFQPLTENQKKFFDAYKQGDYFMALHGVAGSGKCIGEDELVDLIVPDHIFDILTKI